MTYYSALHYAAKAEKSASEAALHNLKNKITNCITEIPQDIKLELADGVLTLKAGSKLYEADGNFGITEQDQTTTFTINGTYLVFVATTNGSFQLSSNYIVTACGSGASLPSDGSTYRVFLNTTDLQMYRWNGSVWTAWGVALPVGIITVSNGAISSIDQVFNGFGYIGSTVFALPNVKGLIPNGRNEDGSLKNEEFVNPVVRIHSINGTYSLKLCLAISGIAAYFYAYDDVENAIYRTDTGAYYPSDRLIVGDISCTNGVITSLTPKTAFHAIDYQEAVLKQSFQVVSTLPSSPQPDVFYFIPE